MSGPRHWTGIMVHHSAGHDTPAQETDQFRHDHRAKGWRDIGYHAVVELVGDKYLVIPGRSLTEIGSHCPGKNSSHIGVCFVGNFEVDTMPAAQLERGARFIGHLCQTFGIPVSAIVPHRDHRATLCPGARFPLEELRAAVASA